MYRNKRLFFFKKKNQSSKATQSQNVIGPKKPFNTGETEQKVSFAVSPIFSPVPNNSTAMSPSMKKEDLDEKNLLFSPDGDNYPMGKQKKHSHKKKTQEPDPMSNSSLKKKEILSSTLPPHTTIIFAKCGCGYTHSIVTLPEGFFSILSTFSVIV